MKLINWETLSPKEELNGECPVLPFLGCSVLDKENSKIIPRMSLPAECIETLEKSAGSIHHVM